MTRTCIHVTSGVQAFLLGGDRQTDRRRQREAEGRGEREAGRETQRDRERQRDGDKTQKIRQTDTKTARRGGAATRHRDCVTCDAFLNFSILVHVRSSPPPGASIVLRVAS